MFKRYTIISIDLKTWWISFLLWVPALLCSQSLPDSTYSPYDSIQDIMLKRVEAQWKYQLRQTEGALKESIRFTDSLSGVVNELNERIGLLESENIQLKKRIAAIQEQLDQRSEESEIYRKKLKSLLWIGGSTLFLLLLSSFIFLLFYSMRTRRAVDSLRTRLRRLRKLVRRQQEEIGNIPVVKTKRIRKIAAAEVKSRLRRKKSRKR